MKKMIVAFLALATGRAFLPTPAAAKELPDHELHFYAGAGIAGMTSLAVAAVAPETPPWKRNVVALIPCVATTFAKEGVDEWVERDGRAHEVDLTAGLAGCGFGVLAGEVAVAVISGRAPGSPSTVSFTVRF